MRNPMLTGNNQKSPSVDPKLLQLKEILNADEKKEIAVLSSRVNTIEHRTEPENFINEIIAQEAERNPIGPKSRFHNFINETIPDSLKSSIKNDPGPIVDTLYPIMGNIVSKYIREALKDFMDSINEKVENQLPYQKILRSIRARLQGISEEEYLLREVQKARINGALLILRGSGIIVKSEFNSEFKNLNSDLFAGLLMALQNFSRDCIDNSAESLLEQIEYGENKVLIETTGSFILAVLVKGDISTKLLKQIREVLGNIIQEHRVFLDEYDGDDEKLPVQLEEKFKKLIDNDTPEITELRTTRKYIWRFLIFAIILASLVFYVAVQRKKVYTALKAHSIYNSLSLNIRTRLFTFMSLEGEVTSEGQLNRLRSYLNENNLRNISTERIVVNKNLNINIQNNINNILNWSLERKGIFLELRPEENLVLNAIVDSIQTKKLIERKIDLLFKKEEISYSVEVNPSFFSMLIYFDNGVKEITQDMKNRIFNHAKHSLKKNSFITVTSFSNLVGSQKTKMRILHLRNEKIKNYLNSIGIADSQIKTKISLNYDGVIFDESLSKKLLSSSKNFTLIETETTF